MRDRLLPDLILSKTAEADSAAALFPEKEQAYFSGQIDELGPESLVEISLDCHYGVAVAHSLGQS